MGSLAGDRAESESGHKSPKRSRNAGHGEARHRHDEGHHRGVELRPIRRGRRQSAAERAKQGEACDGLDQDRWGRGKEHRR